MAAGKGLHNMLLDYTETTVSLNGSGAGTQAVLFGSDYVSIPDVLVVQNEADEAAGASYTAATVTKDGFTLTVTGSSRTSQDIAIIWFAHQKD